MTVANDLAAVNLMSSGEAYADEGVPGVNVLHIQQRYGAERARRLREEGDKQFIDVSLTDQFQHLQADPWTGKSPVKDIRQMFPDNCCKVLILGAGLGGILYAVRMIEAGVNPKDIRLVDTAGGFGGTWYWNRYPGINCDVESYCYLPLLEETGFTPSRRFAGGEEIRAHAENIAQEWKIADCGVFQTKAEKLEWNEAAKEWNVTLVQHRNAEQAQPLHVRSTFVATVNGVLHWLKLPGLPGILDYGGKIFHTSRWDYEFTGGSQAEPTMTNLKDKRIALVGTGASGIQVAPHLARWAKHLYVVQRTPASVDTRDNRITDEEWFHKSVATSPGWQRERLRNFHQHAVSTAPSPEHNLVDDGWTRAKGMVAVAGNPDGPSTMEELPMYMENLHKLDLPRLERIRNRVKEEVRDPKIAEKLQPWYPTWCKRPCFSDEYLPIFNRDNVTLLDTNAEGIERLTNTGIVVLGQEYSVDVVIFATGFRAPFGGSPAEKANMKIIGRDGISMTDSWAVNGPTTLHGVLDHNFPNPFLSGPWQATLSPNNLFNTDVLAKHSAYILKEAQKRSDGKPFEVSATTEATRDWGMQILMRSPPMAAAMGCTPNYFNMEGDLDRVPPETQMQVARSGIWGRGVEDFTAHIEAWRADGRMQGIEIRT